MIREASCSECPSTYELVPPPDSSYSEPKEKSDSDDNIKRIYECENGHRNTIYWHRRKNVFMKTAGYKT